MWNGSFDWKYLVALKESYSQTLRVSLAVQTNNGGALRN